MRHAVNQGRSGQERARLLPTRRRSRGGVALTLAAAAAQGSVGDGDGPAAAPGPGQEEDALHLWARWGRSVGWVYGDGDVN